MQNLLWTLLLGCLLIQAGCKTQQQHSEPNSEPNSGPRPKVFVMNTVHGRGRVVSAIIREDGQFSNSITIDGRTQTISWQVTITNDEYLVTVDYNSTKADVPGFKQVRATVALKEGESKIIGGTIGDTGDDVVSVSISN